METRIERDTMVIATFPVTLTRASRLRGSWSAPVSSSVPVSTIKRSAPFSGSSEPRSFRPRAAAPFTVAIFSIS